MRKVFSSSDFTEVGYYKSILDEAGIVSFIQNQNTNDPVMAGADFAPSLNIVDDADYDEALRILKAGQFDKTVKTQSWVCASCAEENPGNFELCWSCQSPRPVA